MTNESQHGLDARREHGETDTDTSLRPGDDATDVADAWQHAARPADGVAEAGATSEEDDEDHPDGSAPEGSQDYPDLDDEDSSKKAQEKAKWKWMFRGVLTLFVILVGVGGYLFLFSGSRGADRQQDGAVGPYQVGAGAFEGAEHPERTGAMDEGPRPASSQAAPRKAGAPVGERETAEQPGKSSQQSLQPPADHDREALRLQPAVADDGRSATPDVRKAVRNAAGNGEELEGSIEVYDAGAPATAAQGRGLESKVDLLAINSLHAAKQIDELNARLLALEAGQKEILGAVNKFAEAQSQPKAEPAQKAKAGAAQSSSKQAATSSTPRKTQAEATAAGTRANSAPPARVAVPAKAGPLAGLWVKGSYPTSGGETQVAWVMNADGQMEAIVRIGSVVRGARVTGFDGMKVVTTAGVISPR